MNLCKNTINSRKNTMNLRNIKDKDKKMHEDILY